MAEETAGGLLGKVAGKAKEAVGSVLGNDELEREGKLQHAASEAEVTAARKAEEAEQEKAKAELLASKQENEVERQRLQNEIAAKEREAAIEQDKARAEAQVETEAARRKAAVEGGKQMQETAADVTEQRAAQDRVEDARDAARLEQEARRAEAVANAIDPEVQ